jgi:hypothetical protein
MPPRIPRGAVVLALTVAALASVPTAAQAANIAFFANPTYVDDTNPGGEATNLNASLVAFGHTVSPFTGITAADFSAALAGKDAIVIPEQERPASLQADLQNDARQVLRDFVAGGGNFVTFAQHKAVLDSVFGFSIGGTGPTMGANATKMAAAADTPYKDGPTTLAPNSAVYGMPVSALPAGAKVAYQLTQSSVDYAVVVLIPYGSGTITYFGWDWFNSAPPIGGGADGGWQQMLNLSTTAAPPRAAPPAPVAPTPPAATPAPTRAACQSRRVVKVHVKARRGEKLRATVGGKSVTVRNGVVTADLRGRKAGRYTVVVRNRKGRVVARRVLRTCVTG